MTLRHVGTPFRPNDGVSTESGNSSPEDLPTVGRLLALNQRVNHIFMTVARERFRLRLDRWLEQQP